MDVEKYDAGLLNSYGGGDVGWWQDYIRAEIGRCNYHWEAVIARDREARVERCLITGHLVGTDTRPVGNPCKCSACSPTDPLSADLVRLAEAFRREKGYEEIHYAPYHWAIQDGNLIWDYDVNRADYTDVKSWHNTPRAAVAAALREMKEN